MGFADSFVRDGWHEMAVVGAENTVGDDPQQSALTEVARFI